jgi:hypothetical protein
MNLNLMIPPTSLANQNFPGMRFFLITIVILYSCFLGANHHILNPASVFSLHASEL